MDTKDMKWAIEQYCTHTECERCEIEMICESILGEFSKHPDKLEEAYNQLFTDTKQEAVDHPSHYNQGGIECIDAMIAAFGKDEVIHFCKCNAFKYIWRSEHKNGIEDVHKAIWYLEKYLELLEEEG